MLRPRAALARRRMPADADGFGLAMFELHSYSPAIIDFARAVADDPDLLVTADLDATSMVIDVGAFLGEWSTAIASRYGSTVHAYEPNPGVQHLLREAVADQPTVVIHPYGLGGAEEHAELRLSGPGSTIYGPVVEGRTVPVEIHDVAVELHELGIDRIDLIKLNIEGGEYDLLDRLLATGWMERIDTLSVQFHEWHPHAYRRRRAIRRALGATHDEVWCYPWVWELWRRA
jgi:FkbM family methyltransferase